MVHPLRILVVDDCKDTVDSLTLLTRLWGHESRAAMDGVQALAAAQTFQPDVVLLDIGLPGMTGYEVARQLRARLGRPRPLIVAVTGFGQERDQSRSYAAGCDLHLLKPVHPDRLQELLTAAGHSLSGNGSEGDAGPPADGDLPVGRLAATLLGRERTTLPHHPITVLRPFLLFCASELAN